MDAIIFRFDRENLKLLLIKRDFESELDTGNFRRRILSMAVLEKTGGMQMEFLKKEAYLYRFNEKKFHAQNALDNGSNLRFRLPNA